jgi:hypothetical protein
MGIERSFYFGNAAVDQVRGTGWFLGQFVPPEMGLRHQTEIVHSWEALGETVVLSVRFPSIEIARLAAVG